MTQSFSKLLVITIMFLPVQWVLAADSLPCGLNCQVNYTTVQDVDEIVNEFVGNGQALATVERSAETGVFTITLPNGRMLSVVPVGLTLKSQEMVQRQLMETEEGHLRLRSQSGTEIRLRSEFHHEGQAIGELLRAGWTNIEWFEDRIEIDSPGGERMSFGPDMEITPEQATGTTSISLDADGNLLVRYQNGFLQRFHARAHDRVQLRDQVRSQLQQQLHIHPDGTLSVQLEGHQHRYRLGAALRWRGIVDQPGFFAEQNRLHFRYRDGWEQEIVSLP